MGSYSKDPVNLVIQCLLVGGDTVAKAVERLFIVSHTGFVICDLLHRPVILYKRAFFDGRIDAIYVAVVAFASNNLPIRVVPGAVDTYDHALHGIHYDTVLVASWALH